MGYQPSNPSSPSNRDDIEIVLDHGREVMARVCQRTEPEARRVCDTVRGMIEAAEERGLDNFGFMDSVPFYDAMRKVDRVVKRLR